MNVRFSIFRRIRQHGEVWTLIGTPGLELTREGRHAGRLDAQFRDGLRKLVEKTPASEARALMPALSTRLEHVRLELTLSGEQGRRTISGRCPIIVEERRAGERATMTIAYHPERKQGWFELHDRGTLAEQATRALQHTLRDALLESVESLFVDGRDRLHTLAISASPKPLVIPGKHERRGPRLGEEKKAILATLAVDRTRVVEAMEPHELGVSRAPQREQLASLLAGTRKQSAIVVGESGVGKTTLLTQLTHDLLMFEDYPVHRNLDRVRHVFQLSARHLIAGMSYAGQWEQRCFELFDELKKRRAILLVTDLASFGRTGRSNQSDRTLADVFRGPIARGEVVVVAELSPGELARLEEDAPSFAALFARVQLPPASKLETLPILLAALRVLESNKQLRVEPSAVLRLLELTSTLTSTRQLPGAALDALRALGAEQAEKEGVLDTKAVLDKMAGEAGLPAALLDPSRKLTYQGARRRLAQRVLGQEQALNAVADVIMRVKAGLNDPRRPYAAMLFVGPTGTGKTELARALARYLYSSVNRLIRFDMGEYTGADALGRLIGDSFEPVGSLTRAVAQQPFCVLLLDEIEKAHPSVMPLLLQLLDEGRLTGADGRTIDFRHAVVIMTSNLGARSTPPVGFARGHDAATADALRAVEQFFAPELFNRIDAVVPFVPLALEHAVRIVERELVRLCQRPGLRDRHAFVVSEPRAIAYIAGEAFRAEDGARSLRRYLEDNVGSMLAEIAAKASEAALRIAHLRASDAGFAIEEYALEGAATIEARFALAALLGRPASDVRAALPAVLSMLREVRESPDLPRITEHISRALLSRSQGAELFTLESLRGELASLYDELSVLLEPASDEALREAWAVEFVVQPDGWGGREVTTLRERAATTVHATLPRLSEMIARAYFLRRSVARALEPGMHVVDVELVTLTSLGSGSSDELLPILCKAYASAHGQLDSFAVSDGPDIESGADLHALEGALDVGATSAVLRISGLCALDFFSPESGIHILQPHSHEPELVRVTVRASRLDSTPEQRVQALERARAAASDADVFVAPVTRVIRFEASPSGPSLCEIEDYPHAYVAEQRVSHITQALAPLWRLRVSREGV